MATDRHAQLRRALVEDLPLGHATQARSWRAHFSSRLEGRPAAHDGIELAWVRVGQAAYRVDGAAPFIVRAGQLAIVPAGIEHATAFGAGELVAGAIELASETARAIADTLADPRSLRAGIVVDIGDVRALLDALDEEIHTPGPGRTLAVDALAEALLVRVLREGAARLQGPPARARDPRIRAALDYLEANATEAIDVSGLARAAGMSRFHFSRVFRDEIGSSPYAYLLDRRLDRAAARLRAGGASVTTAALDAGFRDLGRFARAFKAKFGATASAYAATFTSSTRRPSHRMRASS